MVIWNASGWEVRRIFLCNDKTRFLKRRKEKTKEKEKGFPCTLPKRKRKKINKRKKNAFLRLSLRFSSPKVEEKLRSSLSAHASARKKARHSYVRTYFQQIKSKAVVRVFRTCRYVPAFNFKLRLHFYFQQTKNLMFYCRNIPSYFLSNKTLLGLRFFAIAKIPLRLFCAYSPLLVSHL